MNTLSKKNEHLNGTPDLKWWGEQNFELNQAKAWQFGSLFFALHVVYKNGV
jgi:hypothetical protein